MRNLLVFILWVTPLVCLAAGTVDKALSDVTSREWLYIIVLSTFAGVSSLLYRIDASQRAVIARAHGELFKPSAIIRSSMPLFISSHMTGAIFIGIATFFIGQAQTFILDGNMLIGAIYVMAFGGAQTAERTAERLVGAYFKILRIMKEADPGDKSS